MKINLIFIISFISLNIFANNIVQQNWKVLIFNDDYYIQNNIDPEIRQKLISSGGEPKVLNYINNKDPNISIIIYYSGSAGTSTIIGITRALIYNKKSGKFLGDFPYSYVIEGPEFKKNQKITQPKWTFKPGIINIKDKSIDLYQTVKY